MDIKTDGQHKQMEIKTYILRIRMDRQIDRPNQMDIKTDGYKDRWIEGHMVRNTDILRIRLNRQIDIQTHM